MARWPMPSCLARGPVIGDFKLLEPSAPPVAPSPSPAAAASAAAAAAASRRGLQGVAPGAAAAAPFALRVANVSCGVNATLRLRGVPARAAPAGRASLAASLSAAAFASTGFPDAAVRSLREDAASGELVVGIAWSVTASMVNAVPLNRSVAPSDDEDLQDLIYFVGSAASASVARMRAFSRAPGSSPADAPQIDCSGAAPEVRAKDLCAQWRSGGRAARRARALAEDAALSAPGFALALSEALVLEGLPPLALGDFNVTLFTAALTPAARVVFVDPAPPLPPRAALNTPVINGVAAGAAALFTAALGAFYARRRAAAAAARKALAAAVPALPAQRRQMRVNPMRAVTLARAVALEEWKGGAGELPPGWDRGDRAWLPAELAGGEALAGGHYFITPSREITFRDPRADFEEYAAEFEAAEARGVHLRVHFQRPKHAEG